MNLNCWKRIAGPCRGVCAQIWLLTLKNLIIIWRTKLSFLSEIVMPLLFLPLIIYVVSMSKTNVIEPHSYQPVRISGSADDWDRDVPMTKTINRNYCTRQARLAYVGRGPLMDEVIESLKTRYQNKIAFEQYDSVGAMRQVLKAALNETFGKPCATYIGGVNFNIMTKNPPALDYRFWLPVINSVNWRASEFWPMEGPHDTNADMNAIPSNPPYWTYGVLSIQFAIEQTFLERVDSALDANVYLQRIPSPEYRASTVVAFLKATPVLWMIMSLMIMLHTTKNIVMEKNDGIKTYMMVMGLKPMAFYASHFIIGFAKICLVFSLCAGAFVMGLLYISQSLFFVYSLLFGFWGIVYSVFIATIVRRPSAAVTCASVSWTALVALDHLVSSPMNHVLPCIIVSLNPISAFCYGVLAAASAESMQKKLTWLNMFSGGTSSYVIGHAFVMLIVDSLILIFLIYYLDSVFPTDDSPRKKPLFLFQTLMSKSHLSRSADEVDYGATDQPDANVESERCLNKDEADIDIRHMTKTWASTGQMAVDNLSFRAYRGQVSVLLGHNGAGKSTTFSVLSGSVTSSTGDVLICGNSISKNTRICQEKLGYCPQYNPLFPKLTVYQHLKLYAKLKTENRPKFNLEHHIRVLVKDVQLTSKLHVLAENLSGGMKRKLCVAIALVADSPVILLDEPTAGMDPEARHDISTLLEHVKKNKTILLTTHYMDEADKLGDRIGIMVKGRLACNGSSEFLKTRFGTGYILTAVVSTAKIVDAKEPILLKDIESYEKKPSFDFVIENVLKMIKKHAPEARVESKRYPQFSINIPVGYKKHFENMFEELEAESDNVGVVSYGLSFNTLEQVFLKVGEKSDPIVEGNITESQKILRYASEFFDPNQRTRPTVQLWTCQTLALLQRCYLNTVRNPTRLFFTTFIVLMILIGMGVISRNMGSQPSMRDLSLKTTEAMSIPLQIQGPSSSIDFPYIIGKMPNANLISIAGSEKLNDSLIKHAYDTPPVSIGASMLRNHTTGRTDIYVLFNGVGYHTPPMALLLLSNSAIKKKLDSIKLSIDVYESDVAEDALIILKAIGSTLGSVMVILMAFSLTTSNFVIVLVEDRQRKFKHQLLLAKMSPVIYWFANFIWCAAIYTLFCVAVVFVFWVFDWFGACLIPIILILPTFFWAICPMVFATSFIFKAPEYAHNALVVTNTMFCLFILIVVNLLFALLKKEMSFSLNIALKIIFPTYSLAESVFSTATKCLQVPLFYMSTAPPDYTPKETIYCMLASGFIYWFLVFLLESKTIALQLHKGWTKLLDNIYQRDRARNCTLSDEDVDVAEERTRLQTASDRDFALAVCSVYRYYGRFPAVRNLTFGVGSNDCFGLLGVNGAGKTTTFDILTGLSYPTAGNATIGGVNIYDAPVIGYCPQFDALPFDLTPREALLLLARISGFYDAKERVEKVLWSIRMSDEADKQIRYCSGGQKRRVSIGLTLVSRTRLIMLDEPTAGIDPRTRRYIWNLIQAVRAQNVAILLTSHSMDECETLCNRIGFMNRGSLISIGTSQHLKSRYGNSFMLTFTISNPNPATLHFLDTLVVKEFKTQPTQDNSTMKTLHWEIPREVNGEPVLWSQMFRKARTIAESYTAAAHLPPGSETPIITDYSITQNSLEQVFLRLAEVSDVTPARSKTLEVGETTMIGSHGVSSSAVSLLRSTPGTTHS